MKVLIGCECSGVIREAFRKRGHEAWSCDLKPTQMSGNHYQGDVLRILDPDFLEEHLGWREWDLFICHPDCTFVCSSGVHWTSRGLRDPKLTTKAIRFAEKLWSAPVKRIALENPVGVLSTRSCLGKPTQYVQPYEFGNDASKKTGLWLKGLPPLKSTVYIEPRMVNGKPRWSNQTDSGQNRLGPSDTRAEQRSQTYPGIAAAMAAQWGKLK